MVAHWSFSVQCFVRVKTGLHSAGRLLELVPSRVVAKERFGCIIAAKSERRHLNYYYYQY